MTYQRKHTALSKRIVVMAAATVGVGLAGGALPAFAASLPSTPTVPSLPSSAPGLCLSISQNLLYPAKESSAPQTSVSCLSASSHPGTPSLPSSPRGIGLTTSSGSNPLFGNVTIAPEGTPHLPKPLPSRVSVTLTQGGSSPSTPGLPTVPTVPSVPSVPGVPSSPSAPSIPGLPSMPGLPSTPGLPGVSSLPIPVPNPTSQLCVNQVCS